MKGRSLRNICETIGMRIFSVSRLALRFLGKKGNVVTFFVKKKCKGVRKFFAKSYYIRLRISIEGKKNQSEKKTAKRRGKNEVKKESKITKMKCEK